jgi:hypothetical protein
MSVLLDYCVKKRLPPHSARLIWKVLQEVVETEPEGIWFPRYFPRLEKSHLLHFTNLYVERFVSGRWDEASQTYAYAQDIGRTYEQLLDFLVWLVASHEMSNGDGPVSREDLWKMDVELHRSQMLLDYLEMHKTKPSDVLCIDGATCVFNDGRRLIRVDELPLSDIYPSHAVPLYAYKAFRDVPELPGVSPLDYRLPYDDALRRFWDHLFSDEIGSDVRGESYDFDPDTCRPSRSVLHFGWSFEHLYLTPVRKAIAARKILRYILKKFGGAAGLHHHLNRPYGPLANREYAKGSKLAW